MRGQALHEFQRRHDDMRGAVAVGALQLQHDIASPIALEPFVGDRGAGDIAAQARCDKCTRRLAMTSTGYAQLAQNSLEEQRNIEAEDTLTFEAFRRAYLAPQTLNVA